MAPDYSAVNGLVGNVRSSIRVDRGLVDCAGTLKSVSKRRRRAGLAIGQFFYLVGTSRPAFVRSESR